MGLLWLLATSPWSLMEFRVSKTKGVQEVACHQTLHSDLTLVYFVHSNAVETCGHTIYTQAYLGGMVQLAVLSLRD